MRVVVLPADKTGCGTLRCLWPAQVVKKARPDWTVEVYDPATVKVATDPQGNLLKLQGIDDPYSIDVLVVQRIGIPASFRLMEWFSRQGTAVVVDSDDAMWAIDRENMAWKSWNGSQYHWQWLDKAAEVADLVTVTTERLARRYGRHGRVEVLPNRVPEAVFSLESKRAEYDQTATLGWAGFTGTHPRDLRVVGDAVKNAVEDTGAKVRVVGDAAGAARDWGLPEGSVEQAGPFRLGPDYYQGLTCMDIGLVPLEDSLFNHAKSWLKALEFSAMGIPVVASATEDNRRLARSVPILLAESEAEWYSHIVRLISSPQERGELGLTAQEMVRQNHTFEGNAECWANAWERAYARRRRLTTV